MKFSIIVPVYNKEVYLKKCLDSILGQSYKNMEVIIIDDGSTDKSRDIIQKYKSLENIIVLEQENRGLSQARNRGIEEASGDYILFVDADDYIEEGLLDIINNEISNEDMFKFSYVEVVGESTIKHDSVEFHNYNGKKAFRTLLEGSSLFEMAPLYAYKREYVNKYHFEEGKFHEDFGLIPIMINEAECVSSINYFGYIYNRDDENSITSSSNPRKEYKKALDMLYFFMYVRDNYDDKYLLSFYGNGVILKSKSLKGKIKNEYKSKIKQERVVDYILDDTMVRKIKKILLKMIY